MSGTSIKSASQIAQYYGPDFSRTNSRIQEIESQRINNLDTVCAGDKIFNEGLVDESGQPLTIAEVDDRADVDSAFRRQLTSRIANQAEAREFDIATFRMEAREISNLLERYTDAEIDGLKKFLLDTLAKEGPKFLEKLDAEDANGVREIISLVAHLAYRVAPVTIEEDFSPDAKAKYNRLTPRKLMSEFLKERLI